MTLPSRFGFVVFVAALLAASLPAQAGIIQADISEELDLPGFPSSLGPRTFFADDELVLPGEELTIADETANPSGWNGFLSVDLSGNLLTLTHRETATDYQTALIAIDDLSFLLPGEQILSVTLISSSIVNAATSAPFNEVLAFDSSGILLLWAVQDVAGRDVFNFVQGGTATYEIETIVVAAVPEPATLALMGLGGLGLLAGAYRRRRAA